ARLHKLLTDSPNMAPEVDASLVEATRHLEQIMAPADAMQRTGDRVATAHHFSNTTYNVFRGGVPLDGYTISRTRFAQFVHERNRAVADRHTGWLDTLPEEFDHGRLVSDAETLGDAHMVRLCHEYLPFAFSRRHGDPSRPWNAFSIRVHDDEGEPIIYYEGNWRDIFQNWEALAMSFPEYLPGMISVFVNASTSDGFNPYRITSHGIDWETPDPHDPWSNIGYWGDHQIIYLLRLLEAADRYAPDAARSVLGETRFTYADVPYRIVPYGELIRDPKATIDHDGEAEARIAAGVLELGSDARLVQNADGDVHLVTFLEKLLVPALSKLSNFVPGGGIWMNTQRPEWNDANNALVGYGLSMVTLYHLRRYLDHLRNAIQDSDLEEVAMSTEVAEWMTALTGAFENHTADGEPSNESRKALLDAVGGAFSEYRTTVYESGFSGETPVEADAVIDLCRVAIEHLDKTILSSRRSDGLYHSYNLIHFSEDGSSASVEYLYEMLEGQVAVLSSGVLDAGAQADVVDALFASGMYRADVGSFMLYPARRLPSFLDKNSVPSAAVASNGLLTTLAESADRSIIATDVDGVVRFNADFANAADLTAALDTLADDATWSDLVGTHRDETLATYEKVFNHHAFTGRSGTMYGYEGIGSIYWHMVAKLLLAVQDAAIEASDVGAPAEAVDRLVDSYWRIRAGFGFNQTAHAFGAIPIDPYSHTPGHSGAQQPGMTGLVKEELLTRPAEVGVRMVDGRITFDPMFVRSAELLGEAETWPMLNLDLSDKQVELQPGSLGITICQVPIVITRTDGDAVIEVLRADGTEDVIPGSAVDAETSSEVFRRTGSVERITARLPIH
ncbi:MAG: hypothetical protein KJN71_06895, partial [Acidimicrobiia bacterium]|nr:hypothetical protein [Acidimicrobiia bacterium]